MNRRRVACRPRTACCARVFLSGIKKSGAVLQTSRRLEATALLSPRKFQTSLDATSITCLQTTGVARGHGRTDNSCVFEFREPQVFIPSAPAQPRMSSQRTIVIGSSATCLYSKCQIQARVAVCGALEACHGTEVFRSAPRAGHPAEGRRCQTLRNARPRAAASSFLRHKIIHAFIRNRFQLCHRALGKVGWCDI